MSDKNNRRENTFKKKTTEPETEEALPVIEEETTEKKGKKKESQSKEKKPAKTKDPKPKKEEQKEPKETGRVQKIIGILFICIAVFLGLAMISYLVSFFSGHYQELGYQIFGHKGQIDNWTGAGGVFLAQTLIKESFGIGAFFFVYLLTLIGLRLTETAKFKMWNVWKWALLSLVWMPLFFGFISQYAPKCAIFGGAVGKWLNDLLTNYIGNAGVIIILAFLLLVFLVYQFNLTLNYFKRRREMKEEEARKQAAILAEQRIREQFERENQNMTDGGEDIDPDFIDDEEEDDNGSDLPPVTSFTKDPQFVIVNPEDQAKQQGGKENVLIAQDDNKTDSNTTLEPENTTNEPENTSSEAEKVELVIESTSTEKTVDEGKNMEHHTIDTPFDPRYELRDYQFPTLDMLNEYGGGKSEIDEEELNANKNKIVETLGNYGIAIDKI